MEEVELLEHSALLARYLGLPRETFSDPVRVVVARVEGFARIFLAGSEGADRDCFLLLEGGDLVAVPDGDVVSAARRAGRPVWGVVVTEPALQTVALTPAAYRAGLSARPPEQSIAEIFDFINNDAVAGRSKKRRTATKGPAWT